MAGGSVALGEATEIRAGSELDFRPYCFTDKNGRPVGFGVELLKAVTARMGLRVQITPGPWEAVWGELVAGKIAVLPVVARVPGREQWVDYSLPHTETFDAFFVRAGRPAIPSLAAAAGKAIVVLREDAAHHQLVQRQFAGKIIPVDSIAQGLRLVAGGQHDAFLCSKLIGVLERETAGIKGITGGPPIPEYKRVFCFAVRKGDTELLEKLNQGLLIVKASGEYQQIYNRWLTVEDPWQRLARYFWPTVAALAALALLVAGWVTVLHWQVRKRTRQLRERTAELEAANRELESFSYTVSHDLRAPLRTIAGFTQAALDDCGPQLGATGRDHLLRVRAGCRQMDQLIDDLLRLARVARAEMHRRQVDLTALARSVGADLQKADPDRRVEFVAAEGLTAWADEALLRTALQNLLENAWKFTSQQPQARIEVGRAGGAFFVRDNGAGFDMQYAHKLFTAFQRLHSLKDFPGTGIGLATVARVIRRHGGQVWAEGVAGAGATFHFTLENERKEQAHEPPS